MNSLMNKSWQIPRRAFLRGLGTAIALPALDAMLPARALAAATSPAAGPFPRRMAFVYVPNGANMADWTPKATGADFEFPLILEPLKPHQQDLIVFSGLAHDKGRAHRDGAGDHARASATFLTGAHARKTAGADIKVGISVDQVAAQKIGDQTRLPSLELGCDRARLAGNCDSGYSCAYSFNISWKSESTPMPPEVDPRQVFDRLFGNGLSGEMAESRAKRDLYSKSILDFALDDARRLKSGLGYTDRRKLDEYLDAVRELEQRIERANQFAATLPDYSRPTGVPKDYEAHLRLMFDLQVLALQTDTKIAKINRFHATQFAYFLDKLKAVREGEGTLLDNCMVVYGSGLGDGNAHNHDNLPCVLAGKGGGTISTGRHVRLERETPMTNLFVSMLDRMGVKGASVGDSTGTLPNLA